MVFLTSAVPVQSWDHHVKDGYRRHSAENTASERAHVHRAWDGSRKTDKHDVVAELENLSSSHGYGSGGMCASFYCNSFSVTANGQNSGCC